MPFYCRVIFK